MPAPDKLERIEFLGDKFTQEQKDYINKIFQDGGFVWVSPEEWPDCYNREG